MAATRTGPPQDQHFSQVVLDALDAHAAVLDATGVSSPSTGRRPGSPPNAAPPLPPPSGSGRTTRRRAPGDRGRRRPRGGGRDRHPGGAGRDGLAVHPRIHLPHPGPAALVRDAGHPAPRGGSGRGRRRPARGRDRRKEAEAGQQRAAALLRAVADGTTDAVFVKDRAGRYLLFNAAAARFVGRPVEEVIGHDDTALFEPDSRPSGDGPGPPGDGRRAGRDGGRGADRGRATRTYLATKAPYRDAAGDVVGLIGVSRDVTDRRRVEQGLRASEARYRALVDSTADGIFVTRGGRVVFANPALLRMLGATAPDQVLGKSPFDFTHPDFHPLVRERLRRSSATAGRSRSSSSGSSGSTARPSRSRSRPPRSTTRRVPSSSPPATSPPGSAPRTGSGRSSTRPTPGWSRWHGGRLLRVNDAFCRMLGYPRDELLRLAVADLLFAEDRDRVLARYEQVWTGQGGAFEAERRYRRKDGAAVCGAGPRRPRPGPGAGGRPRSRGGHRPDRAEAAGGAAPPGPEDGGGRPAGRRGGPRLQQPADRHQRLRRPAPGRPAGRATRARGRC